MEMNATQGPWGTRPKEAMKHKMLNCLVFFIVAMAMKMLFIL